VVLLLALLALPAAAQDDSAGQSGERSWRLFGTWNAAYEDNQTGDSRPGGEDYTKLKNLLNLNLSWPRFSAGVQVEYLDWSDQDLVDPGDLDRLRDGFDLRKYWIEYLTDPFNARLGTFFTSFGYGLSLYVQKNDAVGIDEPIHGATATVTVGPLELTALGGQVSEPLLENQFGREFEDTIWGGSARVNLPAKLYIGGSIVGATLDPIFAGYGDDKVDVWSVEAGGVDLAGLLDVHAEWAELEQTERGETDDGYGGYVSVTSTVGALTVLAEYKDYWNFDYRYNNPPTAGSTLEQYDHKDVKGPRLQLSGDILASGTRLYGSYGDFNTHRQPGSLGGTEGDRQVEWYAGVEETAGPIFFEANYFNRDWDDRGTVEDHLIADLHITTVGGRGDLSLGYDGREEDLGYASYTIERSYVGFSLSPYGSVTVRYASEERSTVGGDDFWAGEVEFFPIRKITLGLFVGSDPGGLVCSGGQCRVEPPFEGVRARFAWRF
jgi:hypothetical protein